MQIKPPFSTFTLGASSSPASATRVVFMFNLSQTVPFCSDTKQNCHFSVLLEDVTNKEGKGDEHDLIQKALRFSFYLGKSWVYVFLG